MTGNRYIALAGVFLTLVGLGGCNGFGGANSTNPGSTPNSSSQIVFRFVGNTGTPFVATMSTSRSSWTIRGVVPLNALVANGPTPNPIRIVATKASNDTRLLSVEVLSGFNVVNLATTSINYGTIVANVGNNKLSNLAPPANPDVRFYVKGPPDGTYNALVEDETTAYVLQAQSPTVILFDSPNGNSQTGRVDGTFTQVKGAPIEVDLFFNSQFVHASGSGTFSIKIN
jgi:hypothetical protein